MSDSIPVSAAREIADRYGRSIVLVIAFDPASGHLDCASYSRSGLDKGRAAGIALAVVQAVREETDEPGERP